MIIKWFITGVFYACSFMALAQSNEVILDVSNLAGINGQLAVAVFDNPNQFPDDSDGLIYADFLNLQDRSLQKRIKIKLPIGKYAIAVYLDENMNKKLDKNFMGIPKERFGFSNNPSIFRGAPSFEDCEVDVRESNQEIKIRLKKML